MTVAKFLLELASSEELRRRLQEDPEGVFNDSNLTREEFELLVSGEARELRVKVTAELEFERETVAYHTIYTVPTIYLPPPPPRPGS